MAHVEKDSVGDINGGASLLSSSVTGLPLRDSGASEGAGTSEMPAHIGSLQGEVGAFRRVSDILKSPIGQVTTQIKGNPQKGLKTARRQIDVKLMVTAPSRQPMCTLLCVLRVSRIALAVCKNKREWGLQQFCLRSCVRLHGHRLVPNEAHKTNRNQPVRI